MSRPLRAVVADDEPLARELLLEMLEERGDVEVLASCANGREAVAAVEGTRPDLLFLDIEMPELDGFGVLAELGHAMPRVIFVTAYDAYAVRAFEVNALDYLLKPFDEIRLAETLKRARANLKEASAPTPDLIEVLAALRREPRLPRIPVHADERIYFVRAPDVTWIEAAGKRSCLHTATDRHVTRQNLGQLEAILDPETFVRVSRSAIVNLDRVTEIQRWFQGQYLLLLDGGAKVATTRTYRGRLDRFVTSRP